MSLLETLIKTNSTFPEGFFRPVFTPTVRSVVLRFAEVKNFFEMGGLA